MKPQKPQKPQKPNPADAIAEAMKRESEAKRNPKGKK